MSSDTEHPKGPPTKDYNARVQNYLLAQAKKAGEPTLFHLIDGSTLIGRILQWDQFSIVVDTVGGRWPVLLYKHSILWLELPEGAVPRETAGSEAPSA